MTILLLALTPTIPEASCATLVARIGTVENVMRDALLK
jgi:hypothetical protein